MPVERFTPALRRLQAAGGFFARLAETEPQVVRRWVEVKTQPSAKALGRRLVRPKLRWAERHRIRAADDAIAAGVEKLAQLREGRFNDSHIIFNVALHFLLAERDIQALKVDMLTHPDPWTRGLAMRVTLLTIYEWDLDEVAGKRFRDALANLPVRDATKQEMTAALRAVRKVRNRIKKRFGDLRNYAIAHRDADALAQHALITELRADEVMPLLSEFYEAARRFVRALPDAMLAAGETSTLLAQVFANE